MHHTPTTTLATAAEPLTPEAEPARPWEEHVVELDAAYAHLSRLEEALSEETLGRDPTADESAALFECEALVSRLEQRRPTFGEVQEAYRAAQKIAGAAEAVHTAAERSISDLQEPAIPYPEVLTVVVPGFTVSGGLCADIPQTTYTYKDRCSVERSDRSPEQKAAMLAALDERDLLVAAEQEATGIAALIRAEQASEKVWLAELAKLRARFTDLLRYRPENAAELVILSRVVCNSDDRHGMEDEIIETLAAHAEHLCTPIQPPGGGMAFPYRLGIEPPGAERASQLLTQKVAA